MNRAAQIVAVVIPVTLGVLATPTPTYAQTSNVVIQWNQLGQAQYGPGASAIQRTLAILHIAMFDAINSIERVYMPYFVNVKAPRLVHRLRSRPRRLPTTS
jgi:hypothetical protein